MDEMMLLRMSGGGFGSGVDLMAIIAFVTFGMVSFLAPVIGYRSRRSGGVTASLFLLIGYVGVSIIQLLVQWFQLLDEPGGRMGRGEMWYHILTVFALLKMMLLLAAMLSFAIGLGGYRLPATRSKDTASGISSATDDY